MESSSNETVYYFSKDCYDNCTSNGLCLNSTCYCNQGFSGDDCSMTYKKYKKQGFKLSSMTKFYFLLFGAGFFATLLYICFKPSASNTNYAKLE